MNMVNWELIVPVMKNELTQFVKGEMSGQNLYKMAVKKNLGPEVRLLVRPGVDRARDLTRKALSRRSLV
jgi:hypothetical protein